MPILQDGSWQLNPAWPWSSQGSPGSKHTPLVYISARSQALVSIYRKGNEKTTTTHALKQTNTQEYYFTYVFYLMIKYILWHISWIVCTCYISCYHDICVTTQTQNTEAYKGRTARISSSVTDTPSFPPRTAQEVMKRLLGKDIPSRRAYNQNKQTKT